MFLQVERRRFDAETHTWRHPKVREDLSPRRQINMPQAGFEPGLLRFTSIARFNESYTDQLDRSATTAGSIIDLYVAQFV